MASRKNTVLNYIARRGSLTGSGLCGGAPGGRHRASSTYGLDTVRTSLPLVRCVMDALTMSPTPAVVSSKSRASTSGLMEEPQK